MRTSNYLFVTLVLLGCGTSGGEEMFAATPSQGAAGQPASEVGGQPSAGSDSSKLAQPMQIAPGQATLIGVTSDGWTVFRDADTLRAAKVGAEPPSQEITKQPGSVLVRGNVVFNWANVDWMLGVGDLSVWTADAGAHEIGLTPYAEGLVAASEDGTTIVYPANTQKETTDLLLTPSDLSAPEVLIAGMGLGSEATCGASIGFVGERLFVGWCQAGSRVARLERYERVGDAWRPTLIADDALPAWSADSTGERVFFQSSAYSAYFSENGKQVLIDAGVGQGRLLPDGSAALYTVGDQLRRSAMPDVNPVPIVTTGYKQPIEFSPSFDLALYSTTVTYDVGTRRDLRLVSTDGFNPKPIDLVTEPVAALGRSSVTQDGRFVLYLTDMTPSGASLHIVARDGTELLALPNVLEVAAANDSTLVFTDNSSDPAQYPVVADLKLIDLASETVPRLLEEKILDGRSFQLAADRGSVFYVRSGVDRDAAEAAHDGLFVQSIH
jgi:hypothetical protein